MTTIKELISLKGRRALINGAPGGLGKVMAGTLAEFGTDLVLVDRHGSSFDSLSANLAEGWGVKVECQVCDLEPQAQGADLIVRLKSDDQGRTSSSTSPRSMECIALIGAFTKVLA